jgi:hypothetical protein
MTTKRGVGVWTIDQVVAKNLRRLRDDRGWTREVFAKRLRLEAGIDLPTWRIVDLEGARTGHPPATVRWIELVALCITLDVTLWDLVLPVDPERKVRVARPTQEVEARGKKLAQQSVKDIGRYQFGGLLSGLPAIAFTEEGAATAKRALTPEGIVADQIRERQDQVKELMILLAEKGDELFGQHS